MNLRRWLFLLLPALLGLVLILGWYLRELASATEASGRELASTQRRLRDSAGRLQAAQAEIKRLKKERGKLLGDLELLQARAERQALLEEIPRRVERIRGIVPRRAMRFRWVDKKATLKHFERNIDQQLPKRPIEVYTRTLVRLGLLPKGYDLVKSVKSLLVEQAAGFYDPRTKTLYVSSQAPASEFVLAHEINHALQDQRFDLGRLLKPTFDHDDRTFAMQALVEGDATVVMERYLIESLSLWKLIQLFTDMVKILNLDQSKLAAAPLYIQEGLLRAYLDGKLFVEALLDDGGWARVNQAYTKPPQSSEQILHPEKYLKGEAPVPVVLPSLEKTLGSRWKVLHENTLGELGVSALLRGAAASRGLAEKAAAGWGGDRLRSYENGDKMLLVWRTAWDSPADAVEFRNAMLAFLDERHARRAGGGGALWKTASGWVLLAAGRREVVLIDGAKDAEQAATLARHLGLPSS